MTIKKADAHDTKLILAWSLPREPCFANAVRESAARVRICPLKYEALCTAREIFDQEEILEPAVLVPREKRLQIARAVQEADNRLRTCLKSTNMPWLRSLCYNITTAAFYAAFHTWTLLEALSLEGDLSGALYYPMFSRQHLPLSTQVSEVVLMESLFSGRAGHPIWRRLLSSARSCFQCTAGSIINRHASWLLRSTVTHIRSAKRADILVVGLLKTDGFAQQTLVSRLQQENVGKVEWCHYVGDSLKLANDEAPFGRQARDNGADVYASMDFLQWRFAGLQVCSTAALTQALSHALQQVFGTDIDKPKAHILAHAILSMHPPLVAKYHSIAAMLSSYHPSVLVANCNCQAMAFAREWSREHGVPYLKMPHGFEYTSAVDYEWDNEATGVCGPWLSRRIGRRPGIKGRVFVAGGAHLSEQALEQKAEITSLNSRNCVTLLASDVNAQNFPDSEDEQMNDMKLLSQAVSAAGMPLAIRCHPRTPRLWFYQLIIKEIGLHYDQCVVLLDSQQSLRAQLVQSVATIIRIASSSAIIALYARVPLIGWSPRPGPADSDLFLAGLPLHAEKVEEISTMLQGIKHDAVYKDWVLKQQDNYLAELVEDPYGDPYRRCIDVIKDHSRSGCCAGTFPGGH